MRCWSWTGKVYSCNAIYSHQHGEIEVRSWAGRIHLYRKWVQASIYLVVAHSRIGTGPGKLPLNFAWVFAIKASSLIPVPYISASIHTANAATCGVAGRVMRSCFVCGGGAVCWSVACFILFVEFPKTQSSRFARHGQRRAGCSHGAESNQ